MFGRDRRDLRVVVGEDVEDPGRRLKRHLDSLVSPQRLRLPGREVERELVRTTLDVEQLHGRGHVSDDTRGRTRASSHPSSPGLDGASPARSGCTTRSRTARFPRRRRPVSRTSRSALSAAAASIASVPPCDSTSFAVDDPGRRLVEDCRQLRYRRGRPDDDRVPFADTSRPPAELEASAWDIAWPLLLFLLLPVVLGCGFRLWQPDLTPPLARWVVRVALSVCSSISTSRWLRIGICSCRPGAPKATSRPLPAHSSASGVATFSSPVFESKTWESGMRPR